MKAQLCKSRHPVPADVKVAIFPHRIPDMGNLSALKNQGESVLKNTKRLELYVTGCCLALSVVINICYHKHIHITLYHYDPKKDKYIKHRILEEE